MNGIRFVEHLTLKNILSFGGDEIDITLMPLNVLIGPNGSGKSNLIETMGLLRSVADNFARTIRQGGGIGEWLWKGVKEPPTAEIAMTIRNAPDGNVAALRYALHFTAFGSRPTIEQEELRGSDYEARNSDAFYLERLASTTASLHLPSNKRSPQKGWEAIGLAQDETALSRIREPNTYREVTYVGDQLRRIQLYREFDVSGSGPLRRPQKVDLPDDLLLEDMSNLWLVLNFLEFGGHKQRVLEYLRRFYELASDFTIRLQGGTAQFFLYENGLQQPVPATRLSDGTLRYLCLLAILLHPSPPPLICIEEPELGLHPDVLPTIAELLVEAAQRTQLIVTTHSDRLISALGDYPEAIVVCERDENGTRMERLDPERMKEWLEKYSLGMLWSMGEIGGNRW